LIVVRELFAVPVVARWLSVALAFFVAVLPHVAALSVVALQQQLFLLFLLPLVLLQLVLLQLVLLQLFLSLFALSLFALFVRPLFAVLQLSPLQVFVVQYVRLALFLFFPDRSSPLSPNKNDRELDQV
jgi:hypothetical protein